MDKNLIIIDQEWLRHSLELDDSLLSVIEQAFISMALDNVVIPAVQQIPIKKVSGQVCVKSAYAAELPCFVVKIAANMPGNAQLGMSGNQGCMCLFDAITGKFDTVIADNGLLTQWRTAAAGAVAAKYLAPDAVAKVAVIGAGVQACLQLQALTLVREFERVTVFSRTHKKSEELVAWANTVLGKTSEVAGSVAEAVEDADIILTTTSARSHLLDAAHLNPVKPVHITAMGSDAPDKNELSPELYSLASRFVCDSLSQSLCLGELRSVAATPNTDLAKVEELGDVCLKQRSRTSTDVITICDLTGSGMQDLAIALWAKEAYLKRDNPEKSFA